MHPDDSVAAPQITANMVILNSLSICLFPSSYVRSSTIYYTDSFRLSTALILDKHPVFYLTEVNRYTDNSAIVKPVKP